MNSESHRPPGHDGKREHYLKSVAKDLEHAITRVYGSLTYNTLRLSNGKLEELTGVLVEFSDDGSVILALKVRNTLDFRAWILGWESDVEVLEPESLRSRIVQTCKRIQDNYLPLQRSQNS